MHLSNDSLENPIVIPLIPVREMNPEIIEKKIEKVAQSNEDFLLQGKFHLQVTIVENPNPTGSGKIKEWLESKKSNAFNLYCEK